MDAKRLQNRTKTPSKIDEQTMQKTMPKKRLQIINKNHKKLSAQTSKLHK